MKNAPNSFTVPLFPLHAVLFPGGWLPLRIFEPRYLDMVSWCMRNDSGFGVSLIREGRETGTDAKIHAIGTLAVITDWHRRDDGLLGILAEGQQRFHLLSRKVRGNHLLEGEISLIPPDPVMPLADEFRGLGELLEQIFRRIGPPYNIKPFRGDDTTWLSNRLAELLPMGHARRQYLLELEDPRERLRCLQEILKDLDIRY